MEKLLTSITSFFHTFASNFDWASLAPHLGQIFRVAVVIFISWGLAHLIKNRVPKPRKNSKYVRHLVYNALPLLVPVIAFVLMHFMLFIQTQMPPNVGEPPVLYDAVHKLLIAWVVICAITLVTNRKAAGVLVAGVILPITLMQIFGVWGAFTHTLNELGFNVGETRISVYKVGQGILLLGALFWAVGRLNTMVDQIIKRNQHLSVANRAIASKVAQVGLYVVAFLVSMNVLGIDLTALAVFSGAVGVGLGFGLQKITSNFISGVILLFEKSIKSGDMVEMSDGTLGSVRNISARYTLVETFSGKEIMVPNEDFITQRVVNWTYSNSAGRIDTVIGVSYDSDIKKARELILEAINEHPDTSTTIAPACHLKEFADSSVNFQVFFWVDDIVKGRFRPLSDVLFSIWDKFHANNIEIPFPQRDLHIKGPVQIETAAPKKKEK